ncbi:MAG TPA: GNAT family N-acetyltransferase [Candidatus Corynebacterium avicola]|uniref:GNAT family N-acetyltransferase n=1 Tax=Candidatus Corynebacterium avicola TaxID=2838527 RepID=A0A9D1ULQ9_9CORY|nr:GNAT family N-acetyltransferase [Candidatus Corynebacterium avicola]
MPSGLWSLSSSSSRHPGWPARTAAVMTSAGRVRLRPLSRRDGALWSEYRIADEHLLRPVEPTVPGPWSESHSRAVWRANVSGLLRLASDGQVMPFAIEVDGEFAGQLTLGNIQHGVVCSCWIGYWVYSGFSGRGVATAAVALGVDHAIKHGGMHRVEATVLESNEASRRVLAKIGFREEGRLVRNLHINGQWRDHLLVGLTAEEIPGGVVSLLGRNRRTGA